MKKLFKVICFTSALISMTAFTGCAKQNRTTKPQENDMQYERPIQEEWNDRQFPLLPHMPHSLPRPPHGGEQAPVTKKKIKPHKPLPIRPAPRPIQPRPLES